ncbi:NAD-dependent epimerase/dehydratase family protein [Nocardia sp. 2]|uniref:NAD-dependent epimerase/dehydratase family protein n=2 Tax=Nocardia acididurans TaxID=2802282 RepID=A0ABS1MI54_9NOCA|nr:NAD-dependent epimerase/dehydratase family protein [Nocardia acididurans]
MSNSHVVITGGAGFVGSHLAVALLRQGHRVTVIDNMSTGSYDNLGPCYDFPGFWLKQGDIAHPTSLTGLKDVSAVVHLACPASPVWYQRMPIQTLRAGSLGTFNALSLADQFDARIVLASSSEVYGDPKVHPQPETYVGAIDPIGPRASYDVAKLFLEATAAAYRESKYVRCGIVRPFNVYGPHMRPEDGRVVPSFCAEALRGNNLQIHNGGTQTRSLLYIDDAVDAIVAMLGCEEFGPVNIGSTDEVTIGHLAETIVALAGSGSLTITEGRAHDPGVRCPDVTRAQQLLGWKATTCLEDGLSRTLDWMRGYVSKADCA